MQAIHDPVPSSASDPTNGGRTAAAWVATCGVGLLFAAAAIFVAASWSDLPNALRFVVVVTVTGSCLVGGSVLRRTLPVTGSAIVHLGALLIPIDVAAVGVRAGLAWRGQALIVPAAALVAFLWLSMLWRSRILTAFAAVSAIGLAGGVSASTELPSPLLIGLVGAALVASRHAPARTYGLFLGLAAAVAPVSAAGAPAVWRALASDTGRFVAADLGLAGESAARWAMLSGLVAAGVLGAEAHRRRDRRLAICVPVSIGIGSVAALGAGAPGAPARLLFPAVVLVAIEAAVLAGRNDPFWTRPTEALATVAEALAASAGFVGGALLGVALAVEAAALGDFGPHGAEWPAAFALLATGLFLGATRRQARDRWAMGLVPCTALAALAAGGMALPRPALAVAMVGVGGVLALVGTRVPPRLLDRPTGLVLAAGAPVLVVDRPGLAVTAGMVASGLAAFASFTSRFREESIGYAVIGLLPVGTSGAIAAGAWTNDVGLLVAVAGGLLLAFAGHRPAAVVGAAWTLAAGALGSGLSDTDGLPAAVAAFVGLTALAIAVREELVAAVATVASLSPLFIFLRAAELGIPWIGFGMVVAGAYWYAMSEVAPEWLRRPCWVGAGAAGALGLNLTVEETGGGVAFADALVVIGCTGIVAGLRHYRALALAGVATAAFGGIAHLLFAEVSVPEPYAAIASLPIVAVAVDARVRGQRLSSWAGFVPAVVMVGGAGFFERWAGEPAWHGLVAGAVGVAAVIAGAVWRLSGPLVTGTLLLLAVTAHETLDRAAAVPTWAWLAVGGAALLAAGVGVERRDRGPAEMSRRVVDTLRDQFT